MYSRAMKMRVELPRSIFNVPQLSANVIVNEYSVKPVEIDTTVMENMLSEQFGAQVKITIEGPSNDT